MNKDITKLIKYQLYESHRIHEDALRLNDLSEGKITIEEWHKKRGEA